MKFNHLWYMCVTSYYVDTNWILQKRDLIFHHVSPPYSDVIWGPKFINILKKKIEHKIFSITSDHAQFNDGIVNKLIEYFKWINPLLCKLHGKFVHIWCADHILHLIVKVNSVIKIRLGSNSIKNNIKLV